MGLALIVDTTSVYAFQQFLKQRKDHVQGNIDYGALLESIRQRFNDAAFDPMFAFASIDPEHEGQQKFCAYLRAQGFIVDEADFRDAFVLPNKESSYQRLSTRIAYLAGMLSAKHDSDGNPRTPPHLVVVTDAFDLYYPLLDYVQNRQGEVTVAFFRRGMEERWQRAGLFVEDSRIQFCDLSNDGKSILGADLAFGSGEKKGGTGLGSFQL